MELILIEGVKLLITAAAVFCIYAIQKTVVPWINGKVQSDQFKTAKEYAETFVLMAQQVHQDKTGAERKAIVTKALKGILNKTNISLTDNLIDDLIEAAVKGMKIAEGAGKPPDAN